jgi:hypothetical protein
MMRIAIPNGTPHAEALARVRGAKKPGRKHNHQARGRALEKQLQTPKRRQELENARRKKASALVSAYYRGKIDVFPLRRQ